MNESRFIPVTTKRKFLSSLSALNPGSDQMPDAQFKLTSACLTVFFMLSLLSANAHASTILFNAGGILNGQSVDAAGTTIVVNPGESITGTINILASNTHSHDGTFPVGLTVTWGDRATQAREVVSHVTFGGVLRDFSFSFSDTAPLTAGLYHIILGSRGECGFDHVMSATNWKVSSGDTLCGFNESTPVWNDGNDLGWDWTPEQFQQAQDTGQLITQSTWQPSTSSFVTDTVDGYGANWIAIKVVPVPAAVWLFGSGLLGVIGVARRKKHNRLHQGSN